MGTIAACSRTQPDAPDPIGWTQLERGRGGAESQDLGSKRQPEARLGGA